MGVVVRECERRKGDTGQVPEKGANVAERVCV